MNESIEAAGREFRDWLEGFPLTKSSKDLIGRMADEVYGNHFAKPAEGGEVGEMAKIESPIFKPHWPEGLETQTIYKFPCDDKGRDGGTWLRVIIAEDGDAHVSMQEWEDIREEGSKPSPFPSVRCRTYFGGGRHLRTRQSLLWLAQAIRLDNADAEEFLSTLSKGG